MKTTRSPSEMSPFDSFVVALKPKAQGKTGPVQMIPAGNQLFLLIGRGSIIFALLLFAVALIAALRSVGGGSSNSGG
ncbi:MAG: hypothetical protein V4671_11200, partial [Armatimonadota bacterium]